MNPFELMTLFKINEISFQMSLFGIITTIVSLLAVIYSTKKNVILLKQNIYYSIADVFQLINSISLLPDLTYFIIFSIYLFLALKGVYLQYSNR